LILLKYDEALTLRAKGLEAASLDALGQAVLRPGTEEPRLCNAGVSQRNA